MHAIPRLALLAALFACSACAPPPEPRADAPADAPARWGAAARRATPLRACARLRRRR